MFLLNLVTRRMEIAAESGLGTTLLGSLMVANRPLATPAVLAIPISRLLLRGMWGLAGRMQRRVWLLGLDSKPPSLRYGEPGSVVIAS
jgi:hypothetical protein